MTVQQQAFLLAVAAYDGREVRLADIRDELEMDQATASAILAKLVASRLVVRDFAKDRRAANVSFTRKGWATFLASVESIRREMERAQHRAELIALGPELEGYFRFYLRPQTSLAPGASSSSRARIPRSRSSRR